MSGAPAPAGRAGDDHGDLPPVGDPEGRPAGGAPAGIVRRLAAPAPGWSLDADVVVVGSGIAGLVAALSARTAGRVLLVTKALLDAGSTRWAQGGIAAALAPEDSPGEHLRDTLMAGVGLCDEAAVRTLVTEGPAAVRRLMARGAEFDREADGGIALTREGGHLRRRIAHAGGDATGAEISRALLAELKDSGVEVIENALVLDLLTENGRAAGVTLHVMGEGRRDGVGAARARAVVLATGGLGQVFEATTNPEVSTGDGVALAFRAGAAVADLEFVQFHPTVLYLGPGARGRQPLISEAVRGEGAFLVDGAGDRFMAGRHPLADLAPRDVVAKGITARMRETGAACVHLDGRHLGARTWEHRFPTILTACREHGIDPVQEPIPVVPAAHYASGGVRTDLYGRTSVPGLYACGEVACTGVHGANRLASNSLLEGLVFAERIAEAVAAERPVPAPPGGGPPVGDMAREPGPDARRPLDRDETVLRDGAGEPVSAPAGLPGRDGPALRDSAGVPASVPAGPAGREGPVLRDSGGWPASVPAGLPGRDRPALRDAAGESGAALAGLLDPSVRGAVQRIMRDAGVLRDGPGLDRAAARLAELAGRTAAEPCTEAWEATNLHTVASLIVAAARRREETRGSHWRADFPDADDAWRGHLVARLTSSGPATAFEEINR